MKTSTRMKVKKQMLQEFMKVEIFNAVVSAVEKRGWTVVSMEEVANEMGGSKGTIYHYFKSKHELMTGMWLHEHRELTKELLPIFKDRNLGPAARLETFVRNHVLLLCRNWRFNKAIWTNALFIIKWDEDTGKELLDERKTVIDAYIKMIKALHPKNGQNPAVYEYQARAVIHSIEAVMVWYREPFPLTPEEVANMMTSMLVQGLLQE